MALLKIFSPFNQEIQLYVKNVLRGIRMTQIYRQENKHISFQRAVFSHALKIFTFPCKTLFAC